MRRALEGHGRLRRGALASLVAAAAAAGCGGAASGGADGGVTTGAVTYYKDVLPIVTQHCVGCHSVGGFAPFAFTSYDDTHGYAALMAGATQSLTMPPWPPAAGCGDLRDARVLSPAEIATFQAWSAGGAPAGDPKDAPGTQPPAPVYLGVPGATLDPGVDYQPNAALTDDYHCFLVDPKLGAASDLIAFDIHPGAAAIVHHVLLFSVSPAQMSAVQALDDAEPGVGWTCFAGSGVEGTPTIGGWVPGSGPSVFPPPTGIPLAAGTKVVMQVHYNLLTIKDVPDRTTADLYFSATPVAKRAAIAGVLNNTFVIPAGAASMTVTADLPINRAYSLWGVVPHMHLHGTEIKVQIQHADGTSTCAVDIPRWNFHWQQFYYYQQPLSVVAGDTIHLACTYDNSAADQPVINGVQPAPAPLTWGEKTTDEMCLNYLYFTLP
jgi:Copper type II ascorbate-dependent monooxygenase, C-terminal domain